MTTVYEGMFLLDNQAVREDWKQAKAMVTGTIEKHGGKILTARRWDERRLAYPVKGRKRATYVITYYELPGEAMQATRREFDLSESVLRYLWLAVDEVPEDERALAEAEEADDFTVPEPPDDDAIDEEEESESEEGAEKSEGGEKSSEDGEKAEAPAEGAEAKSDDAEAKAADAGTEGAPAEANAEAAQTSEGEDAPKEG